MVVLDEATRLNYNISSDFNSSKGNAGTLTFNVDLPCERTIFCNEIVIAIPKGSLSENDSFTPSVDTDKWKCSVGDLTKGEELGLHNSSQFIPIKFTCQKNCEEEFKTPFTFKIGVNNIAKKSGRIEEFYIIECSKDSVAGMYNKSDRSVSISI